MNAIVVKIVCIIAVASNVVADAIHASFAEAADPHILSISTCIGQLC